MLCLRPTPALGIKRGNSPCPPELPGHPPEATQVPRGACFPADHESTASSVPQRWASFLHFPAVLLQGGQHLGITGRHQWVTGNTQTQVLTASPAATPPVHLPHSCRLIFLPWNPAHALSGLGRQPRDFPLGTSRRCQGQATGLCPFQSGCSCPRSPPAGPGPPLRKAHVPSPLPMLLPPLPRPSLLTRE